MKDINYRDTTAWKILHTLSIIISIALTIMLIVSFLVKDTNSMILCAFVIIGSILLDKD